MRPLILLAALALVAPAVAQERQWEAAPVPSIGDGDIIMPAARAGERVADDHATPFSSIPTDAVAANGATSADGYNGVKTPDLSK